MPLEVFFSDLASSCQWFCFHIMLRKQDFQSLKLELPDQIDTIYGLSYSILHESAFATPQL